MVSSPMYVSSPNENNPTNQYAIITLKCIYTLSSTLSSSSSDWVCKEVRRMTLKNIVPMKYEL